MPDALTSARAARRRKAESLRSLKDGTLRLPDVISSPPGPLKMVSLWTCINATHNMGPVGVKQVCVDAAVWPYTQMQDLTAEQRKRLINSLPKRAQ